MADQTRTELEAKINGYRQYARQAEPVTKKRIDELIAELEQQLREIDK